MAKTNSTPVPTPKSFPQDRASELALSRSVRVRNTYGLGFPVRGGHRMRISALWETEAIPNEGIRRVCKAINILGLGWGSVWIGGVLVLLTQGEGAGGFLVGALLGVIGYVCARTLSWIISGFAKSPK